MRALAGQFSTAGGEFETNLKGVGQAVEKARDDLVTEMGELLKEAAQLDTDMTAEMTSLRGQFDGTDYVGANQKLMDADLAAVEQQVAANQSAIQTFLGDADGVVKGSLSDILNTLKESLDTGAANAKDCAEIMKTNVISQTDRFDEVLNTVR